MLCNALQLLATIQYTLKSVTNINYTWMIENRTQSRLDNISHNLRSTYNKTCQIQDKIQIRQQTFSKIYSFLFFFIIQKHL